MGVIKYVGIGKLSSGEQAIIKTLAEKYSEKYSRKTNDFNMTVTLKEYDVTGKRVKYSIHGKVEAPKAVVAASAADWDLRRTLHMTFEKLEKELEHKLKPEGRREVVGIKKGFEVSKDIQGIKNRQ